MTPEGYWARLKAMGIVPTHRGRGDYYMAKDRSGMVRSVPDPVPLSEGERRAVLEGLARTTPGTGLN